MATDPPRVAVIEGRRTLIVERDVPLPEALALLLEGGRDSKGRLWMPLKLTHRQALKLGGTRVECMAQDHRLQGWLQGWHTGSDRAIRFLRLEACVDCGSICVRDRSADMLDGMPTGGRLPLHKDHVLAWYSGARANNRTFGRSH